MKKQENIPELHWGVNGNVGLFVSFPWDDHGLNHHSSDIISDHASLRTCSAYRPSHYHEIKLWSLMSWRQKIDKLNDGVEPQFDLSQI